MQAPKELTLSGLEDVSRRKFDAAPNTPARGAEGTAADCAELRSFRHGWMALRWQKGNIWQQIRTTERCWLALYPGSHDANSSLFLVMPLKKR